MKNRIVYTTLFIAVTVLFLSCVLTLWIASGSWPSLVSGSEYCNENAHLVNPNCIEEAVDVIFGIYAVMAATFFVGFAGIVFFVTSILGIFGVYYRNNVLFIINSILSILLFAISIFFMKIFYSNIFVGLIWTLGIITVIAYNVTYSFLFAKKKEPTPQQPVTIIQAPTNS